ncbi:MAG: hypothetical protein V7K50_20350 [Nostoc sp.]|uniref:hypothetical protein n=1 Tax=Nostoc sp. TaxID=1180 RepID=UPI002FF7F6C5
MSNSQNIYLSISFRSPEISGSLQTIKLHGVPGQELNNGECVLDNEMKKFCMDNIVAKIFRRSLDLNSEFNRLEIWFYNSNTARQKISYFLPEVDERDLLILSNISTSKLKQIYVLDNELEGNELTDWHKEVKSLFKPLFEEFVIMSDNLKSVPLFKGIESVISKGILHYEMKQNLFFDTLMIQVD